MALRPVVNFDYQRIDRSQRLGFFTGPVDQPNLPGALVQQADDHRACGPASSDDSDGPVIGAPIWLGVFETLQVAKPIVVEAMKAAIWLHHNAVDGANTLRHRTQFVHQLHRHQFMRLRDVAPRQTQRRQTSYGGFDMFNLNREVTVRPFKPVFFYPVVVEDGGARLKHRHPHDARQLELIAVRHAANFPYFLLAGGKISLTTCLPSTTFVI